MGFERNYQIKVPSKQLNYFSTLHSNNRLNPWFVTGLADSEGTFTIMIDPNQKRTLGWRVQAKFQIGLHKRDLDLLLQLQQFFGGIGLIHISEIREIVSYTIGKMEDIQNNLIPHFEAYPLLTQKKADFILFKDIVNLMSNKQHLTMEGLHKIVSLKKSLNLGLSDEFKLSFPDIKPVSRPLVSNKDIIDPN